MLRPARLGLALLGGLAVLLGASATIASANTDSGMAGMSGGSNSRAVVGDTLGWFRGTTVDFHYTKNYFCKTPPSSKAPSQCEVGAKYKQVPSQHFDPLYVVVPIGFTPNKETLQCPVAGNCIDHPRSIDLSRVFGSSAANVLTPAHSHVITDLNRQKAEWWDVVVVGVQKQSSWNKIAAIKRYSTIEQLQKNKDSGVTADIPSNFFLYFQSHFIQ